MQRKKANLSLTFWLTLTIGFIILLMIGLVILGSYDRTFSLNIINETSAGSSTTKEEAIKRKTFVCDLVTPTTPFYISKTHILYVESGWVERPWITGFWYWTTNIDTSRNWYEVTVIRHKSNLNTAEWPIINKGKDTSGYGSQLQDDNNNKRLTGTIDDLPSSDTLSYTVLKRDTIDFRPSNIEGTLILLLKKN